MKHLISILLSLLSALPLLAGQTADSIASVSSAGSDTVAVKKNIIRKIIAYFDNTNKPHPDKAFDVSFIGGPYYSSDTKFGIGLVAAGMYRCHGVDSLLPKSNVSLYLKATTSLFFQLGVEGTNIFRGDRRLHYDVNFSSVKSKFWGIGYDMNVDDANESNYKYLASSATADFTWKLADGLYLGPRVDFEYVNGRKFGKPWLWDGEDKRTFNFGVGFTVIYDTRDDLNNAYRGVYMRFNQQFNPRFMLNRNAFSMSELTFSAYRQLWKGAVLAGDFHTRLTYGNTPWGLLSTFGGSDDMRGYYEGRYRDKCVITGCVELRQHVWRRNGLVAWVGAGTVFDRFESLRWRKVLPNYGIGYRWEFKHRVNVRLDLGFGRHCKGFIFSINEAF